MHVDINSYFATMLQQENPTLRGKPIGIIKSQGRTCLIATSKEAKKLGVGTGTYLADARLRIPNITLVPAQFDIMLAATHKLKALFTSFSPKVEIFSLDEAFLDLTGCESFAPNLETYGKEIQNRIQHTLGSWVTCNVGISHNKLLAKMAGEIAPKGSILTIDANNVDSVLSNVSFHDVCGIGHRLEKRLHALGITTPYMINLLDDETLGSQFGPFWSKELRLIGLGQETHFFTHQRTTPHMQSVGRTITGYHLSDNEEEIKRVLFNLLEEATYKVRAMNLAGRKIGISLWGHDGFWSDHRTLSYWVRHTTEIFPLLYEGMYQKWHRPFPIIKFGVWIGDLKPMAEIPLCWLPNWQKREKIYTMMDMVNNRFGGFTLRSATLTNNRDIIRPEVTGFLGDKIYQKLA